jgi:DNA mismatch repair ATPase MutL
MKRVSVFSSERLLGENVQDLAINAVAEQVWNSLDADADKIKVNSSRMRWAA